MEQRLAKHAKRYFYAKVGSQNQTVISIRSAKPPLAEINSDQILEYRRILKYSQAFADITK